MRLFCRGCGNEEQTHWQQQVRSVVAVKVIVFGCGGGGESFGCESSYVCARERCDGCGSESHYA